MPELYDHVLSLEAYTVRLAMGLMGIAHERRTVDYRPAERPPSRDALAVDPAGTIPVLVDGGAILTGVPAILRHLARTCDHERVWHPEAAATEIESWLGQAGGPLSAVSRARDVGLFGAPGDAVALRSEARGALRVLEDRLTDGFAAGRDWLVGGTPTLADIAVFPPAMLSHDAGIGHEDYPAINLWQRRVRRLSGFVGMPGIPDYF